MELKISNRTIFRILLMITAFLVLIQLSIFLRQQLLWIGVSVFLALAMEPAVERLSRWMPRKSRALSSAVVLLVFVAAVTFVVVTLTPPLSSQVQDFIREVPKYTESIEKSDNVVSNYVKSQGFWTEWRSGNFQMPQLAGSVADALNGIATSLVAVGSILILTFFMVLEGPKIMETFWKYQPDDKREARRKLAIKMHKTVTGYVAGNLATSAIATFTTGVVLLGLGVPYAIPLAVLVGLIDLIPLIGATIAAVLVSLMALVFSGPTVALIVAVFFILYQQVENNVLQPLVYSKTVSVSPLTVTVAALLGASLAGLVGALVAIPVAASIGILGQEFLDRRHPDKK